MHVVPLPPSLHTHTKWRRLTVTLAWLTPTNPADRRYRKADLSFRLPGTEALGVKRAQADGRAVTRGTVQHEVLERARGAVNLADQLAIEIPVMCREDAPRLTDDVAYALVVSLEVGEGVSIPVYDEVRAALRVRAKVPVR